MPLGQGRVLSSTRIGPERPQGAGDSRVGGWQVRELPTLKAWMAPRPREQRQPRYERNSKYLCHETKLKWEVGVEEREGPVPKGPPRPL